MANQQQQQQQHSSTTHTTPTTDTITKENEDENEEEEDMNTNNKKHRALIMFSELLDLEHPILSNKMIAYLEQDGMYRLFLSFITRPFILSSFNSSSLNTACLTYDMSQLHLTLQSSSSSSLFSKHLLPLHFDHQVKNSDDEQEEYVATVRSYRAVDLICNASNLLKKSIENHMSIIVESLFVDCFHIDNNNNKKKKKNDNDDNKEVLMISKCNFFHFHKLMEHLVNQYRMEVFEVLREKRLIPLMIPHVGRHAILSNTMMHLIEMSQPSSSSSVASLATKLGLQSQLAQDDLLLRLIRIMMTTKKKKNTSVTLGENKEDIDGCVNRRVKQEEGDEEETETRDCVLMGRVIHMDEAIESACDLVIELVDELCHQEIEREKYVSDLAKSEEYKKRNQQNGITLNNPSSKGHARQPPTLVLNIGNRSFAPDTLLNNVPQMMNHVDAATRESSDTDTATHQTSKSERSEDEETFNEIKKGVGHILSSLFIPQEVNNGTKTITKNHNYIIELLRVIEDDEHYSYTSRKCCSRVLLYIVERTFGRARTKHEEEDQSCTDRPKSLTDIHESVIETIVEHFPILCNVLMKEKDPTDRDSVTLSAYSVTRGFSVFRMNIMQLLLSAVRYSYLCGDPDQCSVLLAHVEKTKDEPTDIFKVLIDWFITYRFNNMYHNVFGDLMSEIIYSGEEAVLWCILTKNEFLTKIMNLYDDMLPADNRGHILMICNLLRLTSDTFDRQSYLYRYLSLNKKWKDFQSKLIHDTLIEIGSSNERDVMIGSEYAEELGFYENNQYHREAEDQIVHPSPEEQVTINNEIGEEGAFSDELYDDYSDDEGEAMDIDYQHYPEEDDDDDVFEYREE